MARMNISISDQLREEMDKLPGKNWSEVARKVFDREVRMHRKVEEMDQHAIALRLRASYEKHRDQEREEGHKLGAEWAAETADYSELRALDRMGQAAPGILSKWRDEDIPFETCDRQEFWETVTGDHNFEVTEEFVEGFISGALQVWQSVKNDIFPT